jgi:ferrous iron transport protein B
MSKSYEGILNTANALRWELGDNIHDSLVESIYEDAAKIADKVVRKAAEKPRMDRSLDKLLTSRLTGFPIMIALLAAVMWITVTGANIPSGWIAALLLETFHPALKTFAAGIGLPWWLSGVLIDGCYLALAWVVSVMLPPMAIFFPLFTLLEDFGYLPRVAFNLDNLFRKAGAHGKQSLTMVMGFGCNAAGIIAARIIDSPRERLIAMITNNFALCNGRWPTQILIASVFFGAMAPPELAALVAASVVVGMALFGIFMTFVTSWGLSNTLLRGEASTFSLELPPYRPPKILQTLYTSIMDRTIFVLWRAMLFAAPAGAVIWLVANVHVAGASIAEHLIGFMDPFGILIGLNGVILLAYVIAIPANEIVIPCVLMLTVLSFKLTGVGEGTGVMFDFDDLSNYREVLTAGGWTLLTAFNLMLFSLLHNPCSTTLYTIYKETGSKKWTAVAALLPLVMGLLLCFVVAQVWRILS